MNKTYKLLNPTTKEVVETIEAISMVIAIYNFKSKGNFIIAGDGVEIEITL